MLGKYPDLSTIKRHPAHKDLTIGARYSKKLIFTQQKQKISESHLGVSNSVINAPNKLNTFNTKKTTPLPPLSYSVDLPNNFIRIVADDRSIPQPRKIIQKLQGCSNYDNFQNSYLRRFSKELPEKKAKLNSSIEKAYPLDFGSTRGNKNYEKSQIYQKVKGKMKLVNLGERAKHVKECDVQTNDTNFEFHLIIDDQGNEDELALKQYLMIQEFENRKDVYYNL